MKIIAIYPGRFQPFSPHHYEVYKWLSNQFGVNNTFIATSNKVDGVKSPLNFKEKLEVIKQYNIPEKMVAMVKNPYNPIEIAKKFNEEDTAMIVTFGEKDEGRINYTKKDGTPGYYQPYNSSNSLQPFIKHGYIIVAPNINIDVPGYGQISGTVMRKFIPTASPTEFKKVMGWFDQDLYNILISKFGGRVKELNESLLIEGGAAGRLSHIIDDIELTFNDMKKIIELSLKGQLNVEGDVTEKTDGINIAVTYKDGEVKAARNKSTIKNPMTKQEVAEKFAGRGVITDAFVFAMEDLETALKKIGEDKLQDIFKDGKVFANLEIIYNKSEMTLSYGDENFLQIHNLIEYDDNANEVAVSLEGGPILQKMISLVDANVQKEFKIIPPVVLDLKQIDNYESKMKEYFKQIDKLQKQYNLNGSNTLQDYYFSFWRQYIKDNFGIKDDDVINGLATRWVGINKSFRLDRKNIENPETLEKIKEFEKSKEALKIQREQVKDFELLFLKISVEVLSNASNYLIANPDKQVQRIKKNLDAAINKIKNSNNPEDLKVLDRYFTILQKIGGIDSIIPAEGLVFKFKGNLYKMTGSFAPVHQIIGHTKFRMK